MSQPAHGPALAHRDDIQGLRAIAVLTVIGSHASVPFLPGGFVGVDVFFVISGFLISQLLFREVEKSGRLSIPGFYARRARRILPAATLVTIATIVASAIWLSAVDLLEVVEGRAVGGVLRREHPLRRRRAPTTSPQEEPPSPLQHYWSLSVEEQFYLVWPALLLVLVLLAAPARAASARLVFGVLVVLTGASFVWSRGEHVVGPAGGVLLDAGAGLGAGARRADRAGGGDGRGADAVAWCAASCAWPDWC